MDDSVQQLTGIAAEQSVQTPPPVESVAWFPLMTRDPIGSGIAPPWWSPRRDLFLREFWKESDHLSMVMYTAMSILTGIPVRVEAKDRTISEHVDEAEWVNNLLFHVSEFGETLSAAMTKFVMDYLSTDNGAFLEVIGGGDKGGPLVGRPLAVAHLDSAYCWRTGNPDYPVVYHNPLDGKAYKLHSSRVIFMSQMPSPDRLMFGVGFCAVSRSVQVAQNLTDIYNYKQEKLGSRPVSTLLVGKGYTARTIMEAVTLANQAMDQQGLSRYSRVVGVGNMDPESDISELSLNRFDPFDEQTAINLGMYALANAFGIPISEVWAYSDSGARRAVDNQVSRQRGKLPAEFSDVFGRQLALKYLPDYLRIVSDYTDDTQDERRAVINDIRARHRQRDTVAHILSIRGGREQMLRDGEFSREQFVRAELADGRLENGAPVETLFYSPDPFFVRMLDLGVPAPTLVSANDPRGMLLRIDAAITRVYTMFPLVSGQDNTMKLHASLAALLALKGAYMTLQEATAIVPQQPEGPTVEQDVATRDPGPSNPGRVEQFG